MAAGGTISGGPVTVLHVDTSSDVPEALAETLASKEGCFEVVSEAEPADALARLATTDFDCLVSRYDLPGMNGVELLRAVRERDETLPVILFTGQGDEGVASRAISAGVTDYIPRQPGENGIDTLATRVEELGDVGQSVSETNSRYDRAQIERFLEAFPDAVFVINEDGCYLDYITGGDRSLLYDDVDELLGQRYHDVLPEDTADRFLDTIGEALDTGDQQQIEYQLDVKSGTRWFEARVGPLDTQSEPRTAFWIARDITERRELERTYREVFENVSDGLVIHDPATGDILEVNERYCELTGYDRGELLDGTVRQVMPADPDHSYEDVLARIRRAREEGPQLFEFRAEKKNGEIFLADVHLRTIEIRGEERVLASVRDITERKRRKQEYEQIFHGVNDIITIHDPETAELLDVNDTFCELLGYDREEILDMGITGYSPTEDGYTMEQARAFVQDVIDSDEPKQTEWTVQTRGGDIRWLDVKGTTVEIGGQLQYVSISRDVTERRRREREYEQIFNNVNDIIAVRDPESGEIIDVNQSYADLLGYDRAEMQGMTISDIGVPEEGYDEEQGMEHLRSVMESDEPVEFEWKVEGADGQSHLMDVRGTASRINGAQRYLAIGRDITERKYREQRLEVFNRILRHNLRNQLDVIRSHAEVLADRTTDEHAERITAAVDELATIGARARKIDRIMSMGDPLEEVSLSETVRGTVQAMEPTRGNVGVTTRVPRSALLRTNGEAMQIAVESALENAIEHAESTVTVCVEEMTDGYTVTIEDDGPGIPDEELVPIEARSETNLRHGRGLGLWQLRWSVDKLNGELSFDTANGTTVRITIPDQRETGLTDS